MKQRRHEVAIKERTTAIPQTDYARLLLALPRARAGGFLSVAEVGFDRSGRKREGLAQRHGGTCINHRQDYINRLVLSRDKVSHVASGLGLSGLHALEAETG